MSDAGGTKRVVIVGGGVAGLELATRLARRRTLRGRASVTLVDRSLSHAWKPMLHTFAAGTDRPERQKIDFLAHARTSGFRFWPGLLTGVDRATRRIALAPDAVGPVLPLDGLAPDHLDYDVLVLAIGSRANDFGTPGVVEHCLTIDDLAGAELFRAHLRRHVFASILNRGDLTIAIVGGGPTGVELAAELMRAIELVAGYAEPALRRRLKVTLLDHGPRLLATFPERVSAAAAQTLAELGVEVRTGVAVTGADASGLLLGDGGRLDAGLRVWAAGVKAPDVLATIGGLDRAHGGQLMVDAGLRTSDPAILAVGDCAALMDPTTGRPLPATAQVAHQQAAHIARHLDPAAPERLPPFRYRDFGSLVALGDYGGWGTIGRYTFGGNRLQGLVARLGHALLYRQHQLVLYGPVRAGMATLVDRLDRLVTPAVRLDV
ncbi:MAG: NAD(P)/FAD-dependent oxidoreductase [Janthinobacterium lividum]